jgi:hypothetical protein
MPASLVDPTVLLILQDRQAPYKGSWTLESQESGLVRALHTIQRTSSCPCCLIEQRFFPAHGSARGFVTHLQLHGWSIVEVHRRGQGLLT